MHHLSKNSPKEKILYVEVAKIYSKNASLMKVLLLYFSVRVNCTICDKCQTEGKVMHSCVNSKKTI